MIIIQLHVMTDCDSNSMIFGHGKMKIRDDVKSNEEARNLLKSSGGSLELTRSTVDDLTKFALGIYTMIGRVLPQPGSS